MASLGLNSSGPPVEDSSIQSTRGYLIDWSKVNRFQDLGSFVSD